MSRDILTLTPPPADERIAYGPSPHHFGELRLPAGDGPHPVIVYIHGGFWLAEYDLAHAGHACAALTAATGAATWNVEYRRVGHAGGGWPGTLLDVGRAVDFVRELARSRPLDTGRIVTVGHSAGGHLALWAAARHRIPAGDPLYQPDPLPLRGAVSLAGVVDLQLAATHEPARAPTLALLGGTPAAVPERYATASPIELLPLGLPQVLVHGTQDDRVDHALSQRYRERAVALGDHAELVTLEGVGHFEVIDPRSAAWPAVLDAVRHALHAARETARQVP